MQQAQKRALFQDKDMVIAKSCQSCPLKTFNNQREESQQAELLQRIRSQVPIKATWTTVFCPQASVVIKEVHNKTLHHL